MELRGSPYFPGVARARLQRAGSGPGSVELADQGSLQNCSHAAAGIVVVDAAPFSHAMIALRARGVPIVVLSRDQATQLVEGALVEIDGGSGRVQAVAPDAALPDDAPAVTGSGPVTTADGVVITLRASVRAAGGASVARELGAAGIGLVRSELLGPAMGNRAPETAAFERALRAICQAASPLPVNVRLLDIAPDKRPAWLPMIPGADSPLGLQGARLFAVSPVREVVDAELAALAALAEDFDLGVIIPYVGHGAELRRWAARVRAVVPRAARVMAMAETPAAVLEMRDWLARVDAVSIGCNDLMQCLFAADRDLAPLRGYLDPHAPALYRFLAMAASESGDDLARVQLCGLLPQLPGVLPVLIGLGFRAFSVDPKILPYLRAGVQRIRCDAAATLAADVLAAPDAGSVRALMQADGSGD